MHNYTFGQRRGLGMDHHERLFVIKVDAETNTVWVGDEKHLYQSQLQVSNVNLVAPIENEETLDVKIRFQHKGAKAKVEKLSSNPDRYQLTFEDPQRAITPGQAAVFYRGKQLLGGGWIL
jgi:tRNA-specific 2-thiouridylase